MKTIKNIIMVGATDRFNYGDLLFPCITKTILSRLAAKHKDELNIINVSTKSKRVSKWGGVDTVSMSIIQKFEKRQIKYSIVVVGGGVLSVDWLSLYSMVSLFYYVLFKYKRLGNLWFEYFQRPAEKYPFFWDRQRNKNLEKVCYVSVGDICDADIVYVKEVIKNADYFSLRTYQNIEKVGSLFQLSVVPDSAILMSSLFKQKMESMNKTNRVGNKDYMVFQISENLMNVIGIEIIASEIEKIYAATKTKIVLCCIGMAYRHSDDKALSKLGRRLYADHELMIKDNIWEIMSVISNSCMYVGSSLHGLITAMSFGIPYVGFKEIPKQSNFMESWSISELKQSVSASSFAQRVVEIYDEKDKLREKILVQTALMKLKVYRAYFNVYKML